MDLLGFVLGVFDGDAVGPFRAHLVDQLTHGGDSLDDIRAGAFLDLKRQRGLAVDTGKTGGVFERPADRGDIGEGHHRIATHLDRQRHDIFDILDQPRHLEHQPPRAAFNRPRRNQAVVAVDLADQLFEGDVVGLEHCGVDQHLQQFRTLTADIDLKHA